jgi:hypothetical protein
MALLGKTDWYSAEKKIILTIALAILIASVSVFAILYLMMSHALQEDIRARARVVNAYAESHLNLEGFVHINTPKDMRRDTYQDMQSMLDNIRQIANVRYLYTAKFNDRGQPMYLVDGLPPNSSDFRSPGDLIEQDIVPMLNRCLSGELIESDGVLNTEWGAIFLTCMPAYTIGEAEPIGAVVMEFNADVIYKSKLRAMLYSGALALVIVGGCTFITMLCLRRLATPFYKKLAYTDMLTGIGNRTAFELELKNLEKRLPHPFTIVAYDLNYMKRINDTYGHAAGDAYLRRMAHLLMRGAYTQRGRPSGDIRTVLESTDTVSFHEEGPPSPDQGPLRVCLQYAVFPGIPCLSATAFRAAVALSLPLASPVRPYSGACRNGKRANRGSAFLEKRGRQGLLAGKLSRIFLMKRKKGMHPKLGIQHFFARKLFLS